MAAIRDIMGWGELDRKDGTAIDRIPPNTTLDTIVKSLNKRFGAAVVPSLTRNRNTEHKYDIGLREATVTTQGIYEEDLNITGIVMPEHTEWMKYIFFNEPVRITNSSRFVNVSGTNISTGNGYVTGNASGAPTSDEKNAGTISYEDYIHYKSLADDGLICIYAPKEGVKPKTFDIVLSQENTNALGGTDNIEYLVLCGCIIKTAKFSYENGSDASVKFDIALGVLVDPAFIVTVEPPAVSDLREQMDDIKGDAFVFGCMQSGSDVNSLTEVAQTDQSSIDIDSSVQKRPGCGAGWYRLYSIGALKYSVSTRTYSNDPDKYMSKIYGYDTFTKADSSPTGGEAVYPNKPPHLIPYMRIRTDNANGSTPASRFMDINMQNVAISDLGRSLSVDDAVMDEPSLSPRNVQIVVKSSLTPVYSFTVKYDVIGLNGSLSASVDGKDIGNSPAIVPTTITSSGVTSKNIVFTAAPDEGYEVKEWRSNGVPVTNTALSYSVTAATDTTFTVEFKKKEE